MRQDAKAQRLALLDDDIERQREAIEQKERDYEKTESAMTSRHDHAREDIAHEINLQNGLLAKTVEARRELASAPECAVVKPGAEVEVTVDDEPRRVIVLNTAVRLPNEIVVSPGAPLAQAIMGKTVGDRGVFRVADKVREVVIVDVQ